MTIQNRATEALRHFTTKTRRDGDRFVTLDDSAPAWVQELVREAHGDLLPDDYRYQTILEALAYIEGAPSAALSGEYGGDSVEATADYDDAMYDLADGFEDMADTYTSDLFAWLSSSGHRVSYADEWLEEWGPDVPKPISIVEAIRGGQSLERREVFESVLRSLREVEA